MSSPSLPSTSLHTLNVCPTLINSSCAWASDLKQLTELYECEWTGAVICRTATRNGFKEGEEHGVVFGKDKSEATLTTLNSYGYSPHPLSQYLVWFRELLCSPPPSTNPSKPIIISITSNDPRELKEMVDSIQTFRREIGDIPLTPFSNANLPTCRIGIELNTSCPNMGPSHPPPAYIPTLLLPLLTVLSDAFKADRSLAIGLKLPPFVYRGQFDAMIGAVHLFTYKSPEGEEINPFAYFATTNTLGSALLLTSQSDFSPPSFVPSPSASTPPSEYALPTPLGGLAGAPLHPLALGNVFTFTSLLSPYPAQAIARIKVVGIGGVADGEGVRRMQSVGAAVVGCASVFGRDGVGVFARLAEEVGWKGSSA